MSSEDVSVLEIICPKCGGHLSAQVGPSNRALSGPYRWQCPYCRMEEAWDFGGKLFWVTKRVAAPDRVH